MTISFIICTYNREKYIYECLSRLAKNTAKEGYEIVLVNNNSTDNTAAECERFEADFKPSNYSYFVEKQQGLSYARNRGIAEAKGEWLVFLDDDAMVGEDYIANLQAHLAKHPESGAFGGAIEPFFEGDTPKWISPWAMGFVSAIDLGSQVKLFPKKSYPIGANMGISRETIERVGMFNTALGRTGNNLMGGEEKDIFNRIRQAGIPILYFPNIKVQHCIPPKRTTKEFIAKLGEGVGMSEQLRTLAISKASYTKRLFAECVKWGGTILIWLYYAIQGRHPKGDILVSFRYHVSKGLLTSLSTSAKVAK
jgi:glycosyltransferase involved in cell wall biosynthesis